MPSILFLLRESHIDPDIYIRHTAIIFNIDDVTNKEFMDAFLKKTNVEY